jgi:hypothetical protein
MSDLVPFECGLKWWAGAWYAAWGLLCAVAGVILTIVVIAIREFGSWSYWRNCFLAAAFLTMGWYFLAYAFRSRVVFDGMRISIRYATKEKSADLSEIESYSVETTKNAAFWRFDLKSGGSLTINQAFDVDETFSDFLEHLKKVDDRDPISLGLSG